MLTFIIALSIGIFVLTGLYFIYDIISRFIERRRSNKIAITRINNIGEHLSR